MTKAKIPTNRHILALSLSSALAVGAMVTAPMLAEARPAVATPAPGVYAPANRPGSFADLVEEVRGAVVRVQTESTIATSPMGGSPWHGDMEQFFERFFERGMPQQRQPRRVQPRQYERKSVGQGSGFVISADGYVVTNHHVIDGADDIELIFDDGSKKSATLVGSDAKTDLAVLKVDTDKPLQHVQFGESDNARVGDWVLAIGNPFGLGGTATTGIISARGRDIQSGPFDDYIQIDAPINRGNSGGPLFDTSGKVIGINTAIYSPNGGNVGIGFAVPTSLASSVIDQLRANGSVERGWLGVMIQNIDEGIADGLGLDKTDGALVADVQDDSPAAKAGLKQGDVILQFGGHEIDDVKDLTRVVANASPNSKQSVEVWRDGKVKKLKVKLGDTPSDNVADAGKSAKAGKLGVSLAALTDEVRQQLNLADDVKGALVSGVEPGSPAARQGLRRGDVITQINQQPVTAPHQVVNGIKQAISSKRKSVLLLVQRGDRERFMAVELG